ncbi:hypothetical protein [Pseudomonas sp. H9]|nr:hypothetical protein [Pseudomonas sp. H9]
MRTIIPIPDDQEPDLFDLPPGPAPGQQELFAEEEQVTAVAVQASKPGQT